MTISGLHRGRLPHDMPTSMAVMEGLLRGTGASAPAVISGRRWPGRPSARNPIILAQGPGGAVAGPGFFPGSGVPRAPSLRVPGGGLLPGAVAAMLLQGLKNEGERREAEAAMQRLGLDKTRAADVQAAIAYVWTKHVGWRVLPYLKWNESTIEQAAQAVMRYEQTHPGFLDRAISGDFAAQEALKTLVEDWSWGPVDFISERRKSDVDDALNTDSDVARAAVAQQGLAEWQAHHLIPFGVMARLPAEVQRVIVATGWTMDSAENLIALPANLQTFIGPTNPRGLLPYHQGSHPGYDADVTFALVPIETGVIAGRLSGPPLKLALGGVEGGQRAAIIRGNYHFRVS